MARAKLDSHIRTIIHIDIDCFYAQVEMNKNPNLKTVPLGIQQKSIVVTSNYKARAMGIQKCMLISDARVLCPELVLVNGEDLQDYRQVSYKVTNLLQKYSSQVERLGLDENFIDVTALVEERMKASDEFQVCGHVFGDSDKCDCGCSQRLAVGSLIAQEIRTCIASELNLTTCAGVAHNKLLAKLVGARNKPNAQTVIFPNSALELMLSLGLAANLPGIGTATAKLLETNGIRTVSDLQNCDLLLIETFLGHEKSQTLYDASYGIDLSAVKASGKPQSIGLEDSCKALSVEKEVRDKLLLLLKRLLLLVREDGRIPKTLKLTVRKVDKDSKQSNRETRQLNISPTIFTIRNQSESQETQIMTTVMLLFNRIIDVKKPYHITLLGLSFTKFQEPPNQKNSIASFLRKNLEVHSVTSIENLASKEEASSPGPSTSRQCFPEVESPSPSPKKMKLSLINKKRCFDEWYEDCESPSKLKVADLCLDGVSCPPDADKDVFKELPIEMQKELWEDYRKRRGVELNFCGSQVKKPKPNTLLNYFIKNN